MDQLEDATISFKLSPSATKLGEKRICEHSKRKSYCQGLPFVSTITLLKYSQLNVSNFVLSYSFNYIDCGGGSICKHNTRRDRCMVSKSLPYFLWIIFQTSRI